MYPAACMHQNLRRFPDLGNAVPGSRIRTISSVAALMLAEVGPRGQTDFDSGRHREHPSPRSEAHVEKAGWCRGRAARASVDADTGLGVARRSARGVFNE